MTTTTHPPLYSSANQTAGGASSTLDAIVGVMSALARQVGQGTLDPREAYLAKAVDHEDFEQRARAWEQHEQLQRQLPPVL